MEISIVESPARGLCGEKRSFCGKENSLQKNRIEIVRITGLPVLSMGPTFVHGFTYCDYPG